MARVNSKEEAKTVLVGWLRKKGVEGIITILVSDVLAPNHYPFDIKEHYDIVVRSPIVGDFFVREADGFVKDVFDKFGQGTDFVDPN